MKDKRWFLLSLCCGVLAAAAWIAGDCMLLGFVPDPEKYRLLSESYGGRLDLDLATQMLSGSTNRLFYGAFVPVLFSPLYFYSVYAVWKLFRPENKVWARVICGFLAATFAWSPLGHASFFFVGELYKNLLLMPKDAHPWLLKTGEGFVKMLKINWALPIYGSVLVWLAFLIAVALDKTILPRKYFWINPFVMMALVLILCKILPNGSLKSYIYAAFHNEGYLLFFVLMLIIFSKKRKLATHA